MKQLTVRGGGGKVCSYALVSFKKNKPSLCDIVVLVSCTVYSFIVKCKPNSLLSQMTLEQS